MRICAGFQILVSGRAYTYDTSWTHDCTIVLKCSFKRKGLRQKKCYTDDVGAWPKTMVRTLVPKMMRKQVKSEYQKCIFKNCNHISIIFCALKLLKSFLLASFPSFQYRIWLSFCKEIMSFILIYHYLDQNDLILIGNEHSHDAVSKYRKILVYKIIEKSIHLGWLI